MKLFLASSADKTIHTLKELAPEVGNKVLFIANAADLYTDQFWVDWDRDAFTNLGYELTELDLRATSTEEFERHMKETDILHICGGSVAYLDWILHEKELVVPLIYAITSEEVLYTGTSAGSMIVSKDVSMFDYDDKEEVEYAEKGFGKKGLGLIPFTVMPHSNSMDFVSSHKKVVEELVTNPTAVVMLHDNQALWVVNDSCTFIQV